MAGASVWGFLRRVLLNLPLLRSKWLQRGGKSTEFWQPIVFLAWSGLELLVLFLTTVKICDFLRDWVFCVMAIATGLPCWIVSNVQAGYFQEEHLVRQHWASKTVGTASKTMWRELKLTIYLLSLILLQPCLYCVPLSMYVIVSRRWTHRDLSPNPAVPLISGAWLLQFQLIALVRKQLLINSANTYLPEPNGD